MSPPPFNIAMNNGNCVCLERGRLYFRSCRNSSPPSPVPYTGGASCKQMGEEEGFASVTSVSLDNRALSLLDDISKFLRINFQQIKITLEEIVKIFNYIHPPSLKHF